MNLFTSFIALSICTVGCVRCQGLSPCVPDPPPPPLIKCPCQLSEVGLKRPHPDNCDKYFECEEDGTATPQRHSQFVKTCSDPDWGFDAVALDCQPNPTCFGVTSPPTTPTNTETPDPGSLSTTTADPLVCPPSGEVNIPDESDCNSYFRCVNGDRTPSQCPPGWTFDFPSKQCVLYGGICWAGSSPPTGIPGTPPLPTDPPTTTPLPQECPLQGELNIADPGDCNRYTRCVNGVPTPLQCPAGWAFDYVSRQCVAYFGTCWPGSSPVTGTPITFTPIDEGTTELTPEASTVTASSPPGPTFPTQVTSSGTPATLPPTPTTDIASSSTTEASGSICPPDVVYDLLPHPSDCSKFYLCTNGESDERSCAAGNFFDFMTKQCVPRANANCLSGSGVSVYLGLSKVNLLFIIMLLILN